MNDVFISYSRRDKVFVQKLYDCLTAANRSVWADWDSIPAASDWDAEIKQGIQETNSVLFVLSPEWIKSNECRKEMVHAVAMGKRLFPILYLPVDPSDVPPELAKINWVYLRDSDDFDKGFQTLCSAMDTDLDWIKTHTRVQVRALEWEKKNRSASFALRGEDLTEGERFIAGGANKNPVPTTLQSEYILSSRKDATRRQRQTLAGVTVALIVSIVLGFVALVQRQEATTQRNAAQTAQVAEAHAKETAVANEQEAKRQAKISRAGELAAQAQLALPTDLQISILLGIESFREWDNVRSKSALFAATIDNRGIGRFLSGHTDSVTKIAISPDGKTLAAGSFDQTIILWDIKLGQMIGQPLIGHKDSVLSVAFSPDGKILASGGGDKTVILWDVETQQPIGQPLTGHKDWIRSVAFSPTAKMLASAGDDANIILWNAESRQPIGKPLTGHMNYVNSVAFSPDGNTLASSDNSGTVILWDIETDPLINKKIPEVSGSDVAFSSDGETLVLRDQGAILWNLESSTPKSIHDELASFGVSGVALSPNGKTLAISSTDNTIMLWDVETGYTYPFLLPLKGHAGQINSMIFSPDGKTLASSSADKDIILWDVSTLLNSIPTNPLFEKPRKQPLSAFSPTGKTVVTLNSDNAFALHDMDGRPVGPPFDGPAGSVRRVRFSPDGRTLVSLTGDASILLWDAETGQLMRSPLSGVQDQVISVVVSSDRKTLASGNEDGTIDIWDVESGQIIDVLKGHTDSVRDVAFSPDGTMLASGSDDKTIFLWDMKTRKPITTLTEHTDMVYELTFSPDGGNLASVTESGTTIFWDVETRQPIGQFGTGNSPLGFGSDGKTLFTWDAVWDLDPESWIETSCGRVGRNLTRAEWEKYGFTEPYRKTCEQWPLEPEVTAMPTATP